MHVSYGLKFPEPKNHYAHVTMSFDRPKEENQLTLFMPSWSPGSYLMREYARNVRSIKALTQKGESLYLEQVHKGQWLIDFDHFELNSSCERVTVEYEVYCHELTVRTSHIDESHAFIHGPSVFLGILDELIEKPILTIDIPPTWSKVTTALKDVSTKREEFHYQAEDYDALIDTPLEIGCHETDGFMMNGKAHELAFFGTRFPEREDLKSDVKTIVDHVSKTLGEMPYEEKYTFITHFVPRKFGGLEHRNSTALHFCPFKLQERKGYLRWIELVAHEYFHTWNVKRIRPVELGPFDYVNEGLTRMHWLTEGLTSFMDQLFVYRAGFATLEEYCEMLKDNLNAYWKTPGRRFHSLEDSSFNAWIKLYRAGENFRNSSISYYLKGGLVFFALNALFVGKGKSIDDLLSLLWERYKKNPEKGMVETEVFDMIKKVGGTDVLAQFETMIKTTEEIDFQEICENIGLKFITEGGDRPYLGVNPSYKDGRVTIDSVVLDGPAYKSGLNAEDEILAINGMRVFDSEFKELDKILKADQKYQFTISRLNYLVDITVIAGKTPTLLKELAVEDKNKCEKALKGKTT